MTVPVSLRLRDHAYSNFTEMLLARDIQPGQIVSQRELVELTGMPLGAIREMIPRLEADGLIKTVPKRGLQVLSIDLDLVRNAFQLRSIIEGEAILQFCRTAPLDVIDRLTREHQQIRDTAATSVSPDILQTAQQIDWAFHDQIIDAMGNAIISDIHRVNAIKIRLIRNTDTRILPELLVPVFDEHLAILAALKDRDGTGAVRAIHAHIESAKKRALGM
ncbi:GntR family transcriptional regulator [Roseobacter ponti]|uniref:GntR family transcriptional regulator n=1 Tax=Roseobacter ponti TaxID=1891787 RepID=A0A858SWX1_9RHOB|nr:GntR family transcriptional regulator [Roseobacter ponti]QJF52322.1 GntR family transcriptional regulator [Roseobacter ponti]